MVIWLFYRQHKHLEEYKSMEGVFWVYELTNMLQVCWCSSSLSSSLCLLLRFISTTAPCLRTRCPMWTAQERNTASNSCSISSRPTTMRWVQTDPLPHYLHPSIHLSFPPSPPLLQGNSEIKGEKRGGRRGKNVFLMGGNEIVRCLCV